jgi:hypothetical protein
MSTRVDTGECPLRIGEKTDLLPPRERLCE